MDYFRTDFQYRMIPVRREFEYSIETSLFRTCFDSTNYFTLAEKKIYTLDEFRYSTDNLITAIVHIGDDFFKLDVNTIPLRKVNHTRNYLEEKCKRLGIQIEADSKTSQEIYRICEIFERIDELTSELDKQTDIILKKLGIKIRKGSYGKKYLHRKVLLIVNLQSDILYHALLRKFPMKFDNNLRIA